MSDWSDSAADTESAASNDSSEDEDLANARVSPDWESHRDLLERHGFQLDTVGDVKRIYEEYWESSGFGCDHKSAGYSKACRLHDERALCKDPGLHDNLFRGHRIKDCVRIFVKAVHLRSRELDVTRFLSSPPLRTDPMNHCIPVLALIEVIEVNLAFIVMEEWSPQLFPESPCCLKLFLHALRCSMEHIAFMHRHGVAHLDISLRNLVTDYKGNYACIDYELSRRYDISSTPRLYIARTTEVPPELERGEYSDPFKIDIWALGILILRASHLTGFLRDDLIRFVIPMLREEQHDRPSAMDILNSFDAMISKLEDVLRLLDCKTRRIH